MSRHRVWAILVAFVMIASAGFAFVFGIFPGTPAKASAASNASAQWKIDPNLLQVMSASGSNDFITAAVHVNWNPNLAPIQGNMEAVKAALKAEAASTQAPVLDWLSTHNAVVLNKFWLTNVILVSGPPSLINEVAGLPQVTSVVKNFAITLPSEPQGEIVVPSAVDATWNIAKVRAPEVWEQLGITGKGVRVATTDTGVDITHPDLVGKLATDDSSDSTYPGGWIEYDYNGNIVAGSKPHDSWIHGTATASLIVGGIGKGNGAPGQGLAIGMAPDATLMHALTLPGGGGTFAQVVAGLQWVIDPVDQYGNKAGAPAQVSSHSWGAFGYYDQLIEPIRNMKAAGHVVVAAIGNEGNGNTRSPGNVFETLAAGSTNINDDVSSWSSGAKVCKSNWGNPPDDWPDCYIKPDVSAPGENVVVAIPGGGYIYWSGTSFSSPHTGGLATLMVSANPTLTVDEVNQGIEQHAVWTDKYSSERPDTRYGWGRIDAFESVLPVAFKQGFRGIVTDASTGKPVDQAIITVVELGRSVKSKTDGSFEIRIPVGSYTLQVTRFAYLDQTLGPISVPEKIFVKKNIALTPAPRGTLKGVVALDSSGIGIPGVLVDVLKIPVTIRGETGWDGSFSLSLPVGTYAIQSKLDGFSCNGGANLAVAEGAETSTALACSKLPRVAVIGDLGGQIATFLKTKNVAADDVDWSVVSQVSKYDLVVLAWLARDPGQTTFNALISATDASHTGVMFLDSYGGGYSFWGPSGIALRSQYMGDPAWRSDDWQYYTTTYYEVTQDHAIFAGLGSVGTKIVHVGPSTVYNTHSWFTVLAGTKLTVVANMAMNYYGSYVVHGPGIAYQQRTNNRHILLSSSGPNYWTGVSDWSDASKQLFAQAVTWTARPVATVFAIWDTVADGQWTLQPDPAVGLWSQDTTVPIGVKNVGTVSGSTDVMLNVKNVEWARQTVTLASGGEKTVNFNIQHWTTNDKGTFVIHDVNPPGRDTPYGISSLHLGGAFVIRPPLVTVSAFAIDLPVNPIPLQDATVQILWKDSGNNPFKTNKWFLLDEGSIGPDAKLNFASPRSREAYTIIVREENYGILVQRSYLLTMPVSVEGDGGFTFAPTTDNSAVVNLAFDQKDVNQDAWVYLTSPDICSEAKGCAIFPYSPATLVATLNPYAASVLFTWQTLDATWLYPTFYALEDWTAAKSYTLPFGGDLSATLNDVRGQAAPALSLGWDVNDAHGWSIAVIAHQAAGQFQAMSTVSTKDWGQALAAAPAVTLADPKLALFSPGSKILRTGSFGWAERPKAISFSPAGAGVYGLLLRVDTGPWNGLLASDAKLIVPARTIQGWVLFPGATVDVKVTFDAPMAGDTSVGLQENLPAGFSITKWQASTMPTFDNMGGGGLVWAVGDYKPGEVITVTYTIAVGADVALGDYAIGGSILTGAGGERVTAGMQLVRVVAQPKGAVMGMVQEISGDFFDGATVSLWQGKTLVTSTITDQFGEYVLLAPQGDYTMTVSRTGYSTTSTAVHIDMGQATQRVIKDDWKENGQLKFAPMPLKPDIRYVLAVLDRWTNKEISTQTMAVLINYWKAP